MGFRNGAFARIWYVDDKGKYSDANVSVGKKNKETGMYEPEFSGFVRLIGDAHKMVKDFSLPTKDRYNPDKDKGASIKITSCDVTNKYDANTKRTYYNFVIYGFEDASFNGNSGNTTAAPAPSKTKKATPAPVEDDDDVQLPF